MNGSNLHDYVLHIEAPLRERAAAEAAQRELALERHHQSFSHTLRLALGEILVGTGRTIQGRPATSLEDGAEAAT